MKERVTITLEKELLTDLDSLIGKDHLKNRSHAIEELLKKALGKRCAKRALILCGGKGTPLHPITKEIPKSLIPVHGKPLAEHLIELFKKYDVRDIILSVGHKKEHIMQHFGDGSRFGVTIRYIEETTPLGTAGSLLLAKHLFEDTFFVTNGDELKNLDLEHFYNEHKKNRSIATVALTTVREPRDYGVVDMQGSRIVRFCEKPAPGESSSTLINSGLYILEPAILNYIQDGYCSFEKTVFPTIAKEGQLYGYLFSGQWYDMGTIDNYEKALNEWKGITQ
ncbi:NTP transferase domain-containing protein [Candidatus Woesearchaeota archaeon]|nr:NTP transferase domain-containing protein [Candidatus Woesearchaeota archaeon]